MIKGGLTGRVLHVDLSERQAWVESLDETIIKDYVGGLGTCVKLASDFISPGVAPLAPESVFVLGVGSLVGTDLPSSSRMYVVGKLPASGTVGWCGAGGYSFGAQLKYAGYDHIVVTGKADRLVYIFIDDNRVDIRNAEDLCGLGVDATTEFFYNAFDGDPGVLAIGPAGENKSLIAMAFVDRISTLGRGGFGAVMGSKNLKAIVVRGTGGVTVSDRKRFGRLSGSLAENIRAYPYLKEWQDLGMLKAFPMVPAETYKRIKKRRTACVSCPVGCKDIVCIPDGPYAGLIKHTSSAVNLFMPMMYGMKDPWEAVKLVTELDSYGMDMFEFFGLMVMAKDLAESGVVSLNPEEPEIDLTSLSSMSAWAEKMAWRQGTGNLLADGFSLLIEKLGPEAKEHAPALIKGLHPYAGPGAALPWDRFGTMELGQVLDPRGPHVGSGGSPTYFAVRPLSSFPKHFKRMGIPENAWDRILGPDRDELHVGRLLRYSHAWFAILGSLGICARGQVNRFFDADLCADAYEAATGIPTSTNDLRNRADRVWFEFRKLTIREGLDKSGEDLPDQWFKKSGYKDYLTGEPLSKEQVEEMKREYFDEWGWD